MSINEACHVLGLGRTSIYAAIKASDLKIIKIGRRTLISASAIDDFIAKASANSRPQRRRRPQVRAHFNKE